MSLIMILHDSFMLLTSSMLFISTLIFFYLTVHGLRRNGSDIVIYQHFLEHCISAAFVAIGSLFLVINDITHLFSLSQDAIIEYPVTVPEALLRVGLICFLIHMIKEQTPGHPFYMREFEIREYEATINETK